MIGLSEAHFDRYNPEILSLLHPLFDEPPAKRLAQFS